MSFLFDTASWHFSKARNYSVLINGLSFILFANPFFIINFTYSLSRDSLTSFLETNERGQTNRENALSTYPPSPEDDTKVSNYSMYN